MTLLPTIDHKTRNSDTAKLLRYFFIFFVLLLIASSAQAQMYRWKDSQGRLHFTDSLQQVPEQYRPKSTLPQPTEKLNIIPATTPQLQPATGASQVIKEKDSQALKIPYIDREGSADRVIVNIRFNNQVTAPILVDTGSPGLILGASLARELGLLSNDTSNLLVLISGIGGYTVAARTIVDELNVGPIKERVIPAHVIEDSSDAYRGLIGMDILAGYSVTIDTVNKCLVATKQPPSSQRPGGHERRWWQRNFRQILSYVSFWEEQIDRLDSGDGSYSRLNSQFKNVKQFMNDQLSESQRLYQRLDRHARSQGVPRHWRK